MTPVDSTDSAAHSAPALVAPLVRAQTLLERIFEILLYICVALYGFAPQIVSPDMGWHLAQADWMIHHLAFLRHDVFNYPNLNAPLINEYPFYQVVIWCTWQFGETGAAVLCSALLLLLFALFFHAARRINFSRPLLYASLIFTLVLALRRSVLRPELATVLGVVFFMTFLLRHRQAKSWKEFWPLAVAQILWVNSHSGFILGPLIVFGFAAEMMARDFLKTRTVTRALFLPWVPVAAMVGLACLATPYGIPRLLLPFYHQESEIIRAYVTEMQPMALNFNDFFVIIMLLQLGLIALACLLYRGGLCWSFLAVTLLFFRQAFTSERHIALFALLVPGTVLSAAVFGRPLFTPPETPTLPRQLLRATLLIILVLGPILLINGELATDSSLSPITRWYAWKHGQTVMPIIAVEWMKKNNIQGRLIHRSEIGGYLQYNGYNQGQTFSDTGFGKFSEEFIHEIGLSCERPNLLSHYIAQYQPQAAVVASMGYNWPVALRRLNWRCVYYATDGSVWLPPGTRPDLPAVTAESVQRTFLTDLKQKGRPVRVVLFCRQLLALASMGYEELAITQLLEIPADWKHGDIFWETAGKLCFSEPPANAAHVAAIYALAGQPEYQSESLLFRAHYFAAQQKWDRVIELLAPRPRALPNDPAFTLLAEAWIQQGDFKSALTLLRKSHLFDLKNGRRYQLLAECESKIGNPAAASQAREQARFYFPDEFAEKK